MGNATPGDHRLERRVAVLEELLGRAYLRIHGDRDYDIGLKRQIEAAIPHPDQRLHAHTGDGETRCRLNLVEAFPRPRVATKDDEITCADCIEAFIADRVRRAGELQTAAEKAMEMLSRVRAAEGTTP